MKRKLIVIVLVIVALSGIAYAQNMKGQALSVSEFKNKIESSQVQLVDIRNYEAYFSGHIEHAIHIDFHSSSFLEEISHLRKERPVYMYCKTGATTADAAPVLLNAGFKEVYYLMGGINSWKQAGFRLISSDLATDK